MTNDPMTSGPASVPVSTHKLKGKFISYIFRLKLTIDHQ